MKILILSSSFLPFIGGIEVISDFLAKSLIKEGYEVCVITWTTENTKEIYPFEVIRNPSIRTLIKKFKWANLIVENNPSLKLSWPNIFFRKPLLVILHTWLFKEGKSKKWNVYLKTYWISRANKVLAVSNALLKKCAPYAEVIENPYRADIFKINEQITRDKSFVFLGRLVSDKGIDIAIKALYELNKINTSHHTLTVIGKGPEESNLKQLAKDLGIKHLIEFKGQIVGENLAKILNEHKYILIPSKWEEPFGMVAIEGMACGCIPIVSKSGGLPEAVGDAGLIFEKNSVTDLVSTIEKIETNEPLQQDILTKRNNHLKKFHSKKVSEKYIYHINSLQKTLNKKSR